MQGSRLPFIVFLILNFTALGVGGLLMGGEVEGNWYQSLNKAPWTPPGWVFGAAWSTIMICFAFFMAQAWAQVENTRLLLLTYSIQWGLNVLWNPVFFRWHLVDLGMVVISLLTVLVAYIMFHL